MADSRGGLSPERRRMAKLRAYLDSAVFTIGLFLLVFGLEPPVRPQLWLPGGLLCGAAALHAAAFIRGAIARARASGAVVDRDTEMTRWAAVAPASSPEPPFWIRPPRSRARGAALAACAVVLFLIAALSVTPPANAAAIVTGGAFGVLVSLLSWRTARIGVIAERDRLVVHNQLSTRSFAKHDVRAFDVGWPSARELWRGAGYGPAIVVETHDGQRTQLLATSANPRVKGARERLEPNLALLRGWLAAS